jgi:hypothetical protein
MFRPEFDVSDYHGCTCHRGHKARNFRNYRNVSSKVALLFSWYSVWKIVTLRGWYSLHISQSQRKVLILSTKSECVMGAFWYYWHKNPCALEVFAGIQSIVVYVSTLMMDTTRSSEPQILSNKLDSITTIKTEWLLLFKEVIASLIRRTCSYCVEPDSRHPPMLMHVL